MSLMLRVEACPGDRIEDTASEMIGLANRLQIVVMCKFNSVELMAKSGDNPEKLVAAFHEQLTRPYPYKLARGA